MRVRIAVWILALSWPVGLFGQTSAGDVARGSLMGLVRERVFQQALPGANILVVGTKLGASTGLDGSFRIEGLLEDVYSVSITFIGYEPRTLTDVRVVRGKVTVVPDIENP